MAISALSGNTNLSNLSPTTTRPQRPDADGDGDGTRLGRAERGGKFAAALQQALSDSGLSATGDSTNSQASAAQALQNFTQNLFSALHAQHATDTSAKTVSNSAGSNVNSLASLGGREHHGGAGRLQADLQQLIQQLQSQSGDASNGASIDTSNSASTSTAGNTASTTSGNSTLSSLQTSFSELLNALGQGNNQTNLGQFLQQLASKLPSAGASGNVISTTA